MSGRTLCSVQQNVTASLDCNGDIVDQNNTTAMPPVEDHVVWVPYLGLVFMIIVCIVLAISYYNHSVRMKKRRQNTLDYLELNIDLNRKRLHGIMHARISPAELIRQTMEVKDGDIRIQPLYFNKHPLTSFCNDCGVSPKRGRQNFPTRAPVVASGIENNVSIAKKADSSAEELRTTPKRTTGVRCGKCHQIKVNSSSGKSGQKLSGEGVGFGSVAMRIENEMRGAMHSSSGTSFEQPSRCMSSIDESSASSSSFHTHVCKTTHEDKTYASKDDSEVQSEHFNVHALDNVSETLPKPKPRLNSRVQEKSQKSNEKAVDNGSMEAYEDIIGEALGTSKTTSNTSKQSETTDSGVGSEEYTPYMATLVEVSNGKHETWADTTRNKKNKGKKDQSSRDGQNTYERLISDSLNSHQESRPGKDKNCQSRDSSIDQVHEYESKSPNLVEEVGARYKKKWPRKTKVKKNVGNTDQDDEIFENSNDSNTRVGRSGSNASIKRKGLIWSDKNNETKLSQLKRGFSTDSGSNGYSRLNSEEEEPLSSSNGHINHAYSIEYQELNAEGRLSQRVLNDHFFNDTTPLRRTKLLSFHDSTFSIEDASHSDKMPKDINKTSNIDNPAVAGPVSNSNSLPSVNRSESVEAIRNAKSINVLNAGSLEVDHDHSGQSMQETEPTKPSSLTTAATLNDPVNDASRVSVKKKKRRRSIFNPGRRTRRLSDSGENANAKNTQIFFLSSHNSTEKVDVGIFRTS